jgi:hypothetical protein
MHGDGEEGFGRAWDALVKNIVTAFGYNVHGRVRIRIPWFLGDVYYIWPDTTINRMEEYSAADYTIRHKSVGITNADRALLIENSARIIKTIKKESAPINKVAISLMSGDAYRVCEHCHGEGRILNKDTKELNGKR